MSKPLSCLALLCALSPISCSGDEDPPPNPLASREGFCNAWAKAACPQAVVDACNATSIEACAGTQAEFCLSILPETYDAKLAKQCISAVKSAYRDANLTAEEIQVVVALAAPCDQLSEGVVSAGDDCESNVDCETTAGYACVQKLGAAAGTCQLPEQVEPGEACDGPAQVCGENNYCNGENCVAYKSTGAACEGDYQCAPVDRCALPLEATEGECVARADLNDPCSANDECQSRYCVIDPATMEGECASMIRLSRSEPLCDTLQ